MQRRTLGPAVTSNRPFSGGDRLGAGARPDERALWAALLAGERPRDAGRRLGIHPARVAYLCGKWTRRRIYDYGVCSDLGWATVQPCPAHPTEPDPGSPAPGSTCPAF